MPLHHHELVTRGTQPQSCRRMDGVIDAAVPRYEAAEHLAVRRIHDGICCEARDVALKERDALFLFRKCECIDRRFLLRLCRQELLFELEISFGKVPARIPDIHEAAQEIAARARVHRNRLRLGAVFWKDIQQIRNQLLDTCFFFHHAAPFILYRS